MAYSRKNVAAVYEEFEKRRDENKAACNERLFEVYEKCPEIKGFQGIWWRRGESNPRPKTLPQELLRAQTVLCIPSP